MTGTTPGTADVVLYTFDPESGQLVAGETVKAFNCCRTVVAATTWILVDLIDNQWFVSAEDC
ncbi:hypothetical protein [Singulisphaera sp. PoT]|uniref:hypothetical protein n=1 Tax=Singulisphaera sp. PoT TaxID=3411797 RepID=UPI003BF61CA4